MTTVVNIKKTLYWGLRPDDIYIGRPGKYGNLHKIGYCGVCQRRHTRAEAIEAYQEDVRNNLELRKEIEKLRGKRLGCFCKPKACHGDVIVEFLEEGEKDGSVDEYQTTSG
jgi:hypothetical protein